jgi:hypothetical protein
VISIPPILAILVIHLLGVVVVIVVLGGVFVLLYYAYVAVFKKLNMNVDSDWKVKPPQTVAKALTITYSVTMSYTKAGKRITEPYQSAEVTFTLTTGDATVDGGTSKTVTTTANGEASVTLAPVRNGKDTLKVHLKAGLKEGDEQPVDFETVHP